MGKKRFQSSSNSATISPIIDTDLQVPNVYYKPLVWDRLWYIIDKCQKEVGFLGLVEAHARGYTITDLFVPEQNVRHTETDINAASIAALASALIDNNQDPNKLLFWGHSHVNMAVNPSAQDEDQINEFLEYTPLFIRGIYNKKRERKIDVYDCNRGVVFQCVSDGLYTPGLTKRQQEQLDELLETNVSETCNRGVWTYPTTQPPNYRPHQQQKRGLVTPPRLDDDEDLLVCLEGDAPPSNVKSFAQDVRNKRKLPREGK